MASAPYSQDRISGQQLIPPTVENRAVFRKLVSDEKDEKALSHYSERALKRVWKTQRFSW